MADYTFIVICRDDLTSDGEPGEYILATRQTFNTWERADKYSRVIAKSREPLIVEGRWMQLRPPT